MSSPHRSFRASFAAVLGICMVFMLIALNTSMVGNAMPRIVADLRGYALYQWAASSYLLGNAAMIPIAGRLGDLYGRKPFVLASVVLFALASVACGAAQDMLQLVLARGLQGVAGGMLMGVAPACVPDLFPDRTQRVRWQVMLSSAFGVALALGPWVGGWVTEHAGWRVVFFINVPVAVAGLVTTWLYLPRIVNATDDKRRIDWFGALLLAASIGVLQLATEAGQGHGPGLGWSLALWVGTLLLWVGFFHHQYRTDAPIIPPSVMDNGDARKLMLLGFLTGVTMFVLVFYVPLLLQGSFGQTPDRAGFIMTPLLVCITMGSIVNGRLLPRLRRAERLIAWGQLATLTGCLLLVMVDARTPQAWLMGVFALVGLGFGFQLPNLNLQIMEVCGRANLGIAASLVQSTRSVGSMLGVGIGSVLVNWLFGWQMRPTLSGPAAGKPELVQLLSSPQVLVRAQDQAAAHRLAQGLGLDSAGLIESARQALVSGAHGAFLLCAALTVLGIVVSLRLPRFDIRKKA